MKKELRWLNSEHRRLYVDYIHRRLGYIGDKDYDTYYKQVRMPLEKDRWRYLMERKRWFIMPLGWDNMIASSARVADMGCGDGDTVQRLIDYADQKWTAEGVTDRKLHIVGLDLNQSRVENAERLVTSPRESITFEFHAADLTGESCASEFGQFDYSMTTGVLEIMDDDICGRFMDNMCKMTEKGLYIEDLYERFPGGFPREELPAVLKDRGFETETRHIVLSEPFDVGDLRDPKKLWPIMLDQNIWANRSA
jgi:SAM-dependent methyltransferase